MNYGDTIGEHKNFDIEQEELKEAIAPLLIMGQYDEEISKKVIQEVKNYDILDLFDDIESGAISNFFNNIYANGLKKT